MRILVLSQYFWPENFIINDVVRELATQGHDVTVATGKPNYPDGNVYPGYQVSGAMKESFGDNILVVRIPLLPRGKGGALNLLKNYFSFVFYGLWYFPKLLKYQKFDTILVFAPSPILQVIPAIFMKKIKHSHLAVWVQDLWPESLSATGFVKNKTVLKLVGLAVKAIYAGCDTLLVQSRAFINPVSKYAALDKIVYYPNSLLELSPDPKSEPIPLDMESQFESGFNLIFAGNIGTAQSVETLVDTCRKMRSDKNFKLFLIGSGSLFDWVKTQKTAEGLDNLILPGRFPSSMMPAIFAKASALLVSLKDEEIFAYTVPSKIQSYLAAGRPIVASLRGEGAQVIADAGAGLSCPPEDSEALATCIRKMMALDDIEHREMGLSGRKFFEENFQMRQQVESLVEILLKRSQQSRENGQ
ncbi:glycosyltransferase family 4 protein [Pseudomonas sp. CCI3.2]|uniref:glycosyltransferase family 4 protein n=1 Tax=unclassified Pseudomonas TaxID=196821 RepID=UPI002AC8F751|nr:MULTISPECIES: glycosyltransferase family 4 protein [unclassified Pseudomonas]MEB0075935.1 glycosyltransferase family 4 protein [Pseudomonas sp. MH10out]MEB0091571.1 glycosyltransferase family 4 protein [Pseudomonas sp. CCI4.2]MEB0101380.1 glycosyltransferase family 4 protein [Pseudomonas sp. CCI3.2]MEB0130914.1 glycosyltransferase family 4 protein [Pseudomonas sp. CCI2.4]MEB0157892.1 glycosyltransferase family 4 protein [Pseudomonas sp. AH2 (2023)]